MEEKQHELTLVTEQVAKLELQLQAIKQVDDQAKQLKDKLYEMMKDYDVKTFKTINGIAINRIDGKEDEIVELETFNESMFKEDNPKLYQQYLCKTTKINKGKKGYVRITLPKVVDYERLNGGNK
jgi:hypothetical protein